MINLIKNIAIKFLIPLVLIYIGFSYSWIIGTLLVLGYIGYIVYKNLLSLYTFIGNLKYTKGDLDEAINWFGKAYKTGKSKPKTEMSYAYLLLKNGNVEESEKTFNQIMNKKLEEDEKILAQSNMALIAWKKGDLDGAVQMLEEIPKDHINSHIYSSLGYLLILQGDLEKALKLNLEAYEYNNSNSIILDNLGETYYHLGEYDKSEEIYTKLMEKNPSFPEAYYHYAMVLSKKESIDKAIETMKKALSYNFTFLSTVSKEEVVKALEELENTME